MNRNVCIFFILSGHYPANVKHHLLKVIYPFGKFVMSVPKSENESEIPALLIIVGRKPWPGGRIRTRAHAIWLRVVKGSSYFGDHCLQLTDIFPDSSGGVVAAT